MERSIGKVTRILDDGTAVVELDTSPGAPAKPWAEIQERWGSLARLEQHLIEEANQARADWAVAKHERREDVRAAEFKAREIALFEAAAGIREAMAGDDG